MTSTSSISSSSSEWLVHLTASSCGSVSPAAAVHALLVFNECYCILTHALVDFRLLPSLSLLYLLASLDKANAGNAKLFGFLEDVGMTSNQFNLALTVLFFTYGLFEPICNVMLRRVGPKIWFPIAVTTWGLITTLTCVVKSYGGFIGIRLALGAAEATIYPGGYLLLSMWYKPKELATRMSIFYGANTAAGAFGGVIAYGVGNLDYVHGWRAWRWLFLVSHNAVQPQSIESLLQEGTGRR